MVRRLGGRLMPRLTGPARRVMPRPAIPAGRGRAGRPAGPAGLSGMDRLGRAGGAGRGAGRGGGGRGFVVPGEFAVEAQGRGGQGGEVAGADGAVRTQRRGVAVVDRVRQRPADGRVHAGATREQLVEPDHEHRPGPGRLDRRPGPAHVAAQQVEPRALHHHVPVGAHPGAPAVHRAGQPLRDGPRGPGPIEGGDRDPGAVVSGLVDLRAGQAGAVELHWRISRCRG